MNWEYRVLTESAVHLEPMLNELGAQGFEAVLAQFAPVSPSNPDARFPEMYNPVVTVILKRPRSAAAQQQTTS